MPNPPTGTITFLFTDIEGSTKRWDNQPVQMRAALARHDTILREAIESNSGYVFKTMGDAFYAAFPTALNALAATLSAQHGLSAEKWDGIGPIKVRMALHTGTADLEQNGDYSGQPLNRVSRLLSAAQGGQTVMSHAVYELVCDALPQGVSLVDLGEQWLRGLSRPERVFELETSDKPTLPPCPYRGLLAFQESDVPFFCGRDTFVNKLEEEVQKKPIVALIGPSGSGKSSVVFAGLVPRLRKEGGWLIISFRPGEHPAHALIAALIPILEPQMSEADRLIEVKKLVDALSEGTVTPKGIAERILQKNPDTHSLLVIADQFEELYTLCKEQGQRESFIDGLLSTFASPHAEAVPDLKLVMTMRADFLGHALSYRPLADALQDSDVKLGPMTREELQEAIEKPAQLLNVTLEEGLTERILDAVSEGPGYLPLLEFALTQLWERQCNYELTHEAYDEIGGVEQSLAGYAEQVYEKLSAEEQQRAHRIFTQLVRPGEGTIDTRRVASHAEVGEDNWDLVTHLADARLVVSGRDEATGQDTVEITHEALIGAWGRLRQWVEADRAFLMWRERLRAVMRQWLDSNLDEGALFRGAPLVEAMHWVEERKNDLSQGEQDFIRLSNLLRERERWQRASARRRTRVGLVVALVITTALALVAVLQWQAADRQRVEAERLRGEAVGQQAEANRQKAEADRLKLVAQDQANLVEHRFQVARAQALAAQAVTPDHANELGVLLATEAINTTLRLGDPPLPEAVSALHQAAANSQVRKSLEGHTDTVLSASYSPDGKSIVTASTDKTVRIWNAITYTPSLTISVGTDLVSYASFSPDGKSIVTASVDKTAKVWDAVTGRLSFTLTGHTDALWSAVFSPDGKSIVTASKDNTVIIWDVASKQPLHTLKGHTKEVYHAEFSPDSKYVVTASHDHTARIWDAATGSPIRTLEGHTGEVKWAAYSPLDGKKIVTSSGNDDLTVRIWDAASGQQLKTLAGHTDTVTVATFSPDGKSILSTSLDGTAKIWNVESRQVLSTLRGHTNKVRGGAFSPDGRMVVTCSDDKTVRIWDTNLEEHPTLQGYTGVIWTALYSPDGKSIVTASSDNTSKIWDAASGTVSITLTGHTGALVRAVYSPDGKSILTASSDKTAQVWDAATGQLRFTLAGQQGHAKEVTYAAYSPDGKSIVTASSDKTAKVWDATTGQFRFTLLDPTLRTTSHEATVWGAVYSPDSRFIVTAGDDNTPRVWDAATGQLRFLLQGHSDHATSAEYSPDGRYIVTASNDKMAKVWASQTGREILTLSGHTDSVNHAWFSPDGKSILTVSADNTAKIWDAATGKELVTLRGHTAGVLWAAFSPPDGKLIATASDDATAKVWDATTGKELATLPGHTEGVQYVSFSPDGKVILTASADGTARQYLANYADLMALAATRVTRLLTDEERATYLGDALPTPTTTATGK